ncbi:MAG: NADH-quinone oxidoreductase subunit M [Verrucomicrobiales bacterium]|jgi:NADH-quinone oxidoreductase subunit M|nr:NADH-quinone oxidoreductase subunit M [Verrucomicrobiales bacterium]
MSELLIIILVAPLVACLGIAAGLPAKKTALTVTLFNALASLLVAAKFHIGATGYQFVSSIPAMSLGNYFETNLKFGVDGLSLLLLLLTTIVSLAAVAVTPADTRRPREFFILLLLIVSGALGAFLSVDLFFLYVFHEVALIPTFILVGVWGNQDRKFAAIQMTIYLTVGSMVLLAGLLGFYFSLPVTARSFDLELIHETLTVTPLATSAQGWIFLLLLGGFGILAALCPLHTWAPAGDAAAPTPVAMLHAGVLKKVGIYGLLRLAVPFLPAGVHQYVDLFLVLILLNIIYIGLVTVWQKDLGFMLGYSSVAHMGVLFLGIASMNVLGLAGTVVLMLAHGFDIALLFALNGEIRRRAGSTRFAGLGGLAQRLPRLAFLFIIGGLASLGMPGLANFAGEIQVFFGAWDQFPWWVTFLAVWGIVLGAVYILRAVRNIFFGEMSPSAAVAPMKDLTPWAQRWPFILLAAALLVIGFYPRLALQFVQPVINGWLGL